MNVLDSIIKEIEKSLDYYHPDDLYEIGYDEGLKRAISIIKEHSETEEPCVWQDLTDEELREIEKKFHAERVRTSDEEYLVIYPADYWDWQRAIEKALKEKNNG